MAIKSGIKPEFLHMKTVDIEHGGSDIYRRSLRDSLRVGAKLHGWVQAGCGMITTTITPDVIVP